MFCFLPSGLLWFMEGCQSLTRFLPGLLWFGLDFQYFDERLTTFVLHFSCTFLHTQFIWIWNLVHFSPHCAWYGPVWTHIFVLDYGPDQDVVKVWSHSCGLVQVWKRELIIRLFYWKYARLIIHQGSQPSGCCEVICPLLNKVLLTSKPVFLCGLNREPKEWLKTWGSVGD